MNAGVGLFRISYRVIAAFGVVGVVAVGVVAVSVVAAAAALVLLLLLLLLLLLVQASFVFGLIAVGGSLLLML